MIPAGRLARRERRPPAGPPAPLHGFVIDMVEPAGRMRMPW
jgi:hypothetical protein